MRYKNDLIGKTISGIIAVPDSNGGAAKIWMLQFSDGTHVEFVSPGARRALDRFAGVRKTSQKQLQNPADNDVQLALNVA